MNYKCYLCEGNILYETNNEAVSHLKEYHNLKNKKSIIQCTVYNSTCGKSFITFSGLYKHVKKCVKNSNIDDCEKSLDAGECSKDLNVPNENDASNFHLNNTFCFDSDDSYFKESNAPEPRNSNFVFDSEMSMLDVNLEDNFVFNNSCNAQNSLDNRADVFVQKFAMEFCQLKISDAAMNSIFRTTVGLIESTKEFCGKSIEMKKENALEAFNGAIEKIATELNKFNSTYKRRQMLQSNANFIQPKEYAIGTQINVKRDNATESQVQIHTQSILYYVPLIERLNILFNDDNFREEYLSYNTKTKHVCTPGVFQDFCCGGTFKNNTLFQEEPYAIQIQIFLDAFETCNPLKSKSGKHAVLGVYFTIRNLPSRFAYQLANIHTLAVVRESDIKKEETSYSNILGIIVNELKILETQGIKIKHNLVLRGNSINARSLTWSLTFLLRFL